MPNLHLVSILATNIAAFVVAYHCITIFMKRGDEALAGVVRGIPISEKTRWLILMIHYLPFGAFLAAFLVIVCFGLAGLARGAEEPLVRTIGNMSAIVFGSGAVVLLTHTGMWLYHVRVETRRTEQD